MVIAVKKYCVKNGKRYGPYPKDPKMYYLYRSYRVGDSVKQEYLGKGPKPKDVVVQELKHKDVLQETNCKKCKHFAVVDNRSFCRCLQSFLAEETLTQPCNNFEEAV